MMFQSIAQIKPKRKNQKILYIKLHQKWQNTLKTQLQIFLLDHQVKSKKVLYLESNHYKTDEYGLSD